MECLEHLGIKKDKNGNRVSYGIFLCPFCFKKVIKRLQDGFKNKSCGCKKGFFVSKSRFGKKHPDEVRQKISDSNKGKIQTEETRQKISKALEGVEGRPHSEETKQKIREGNKGKIVLEETRQKISKTRIEKGVAKGENNPMYGKTGEKHYNWQNGISFEPYGIEFNKELKQQILERDNWQCQDPNCNHLSQRLDVHHIDYNKKNNNPENLIVLCKSCHTKTNFNRQYWTEFYQNIMANKI